MPTTNPDLVNKYDGNAPLASTRILEPGATNRQEHAAQVIAIEALRELLAMGISVADYNNMNDPVEWEAFKAAVVARSRLNINAPAFALRPDQIEAAVNLGGNFFEHGYDFIMAGVAATDKLTWTRNGGV